MNCEFMPKRAMATAKLASGAVTGAPPLPKCRHSGISAAWAAARNGSQWSPWYDGRPSRCGASVNVIDLAPLAAVRSTSATDAATSQKGTMTIGMNRSGAAADHSSRMKSFHADDARGGEILVLRRKEGPSRETGKGREAHLGVHPVEIHVSQAGGDVVAAGQHLVEADGVDAEVLGVLSRHRVQPNGRELSCPRSSTPASRPRARRCADRRRGTWRAAGRATPCSCSITWSSTEITWTSSCSMPEPPGLDPSLTEESSLSDNLSPEPARRKGQFPRWSGVSGSLLADQVAEPPPPPPRRSPEAPGRTGPTTR